MSLTWYELIIQPRGELNTEWLCDCLTLAGACSITLTDDGEEPIFEPPIGTVILWKKTRITALFLNEEDRKAGLMLLTEQSEPDSFSVVQQELADQNWIRAWMDQFKPIHMGKNLWICPSWETPPEPDAVNIILDPGLAFGSGTHPTTALICEWLANSEMKGKTVIDYGCGSGILGVVAAKLGASEVFATDIDPQAFIATKENASRNGVNIKFFEPSDELEKVDLILANILAQPLIELTDRLAKLLKKGGIIVLSGILETQADAVSQAYAKRFKCDPPKMKENWSLISAKLDLPF